MSKENVEIVRAAFEAFGEKGPEGVLRFFDPGIDWVVRADLPDSDTFQGHDGMRRLFESFDEVMEGIWYEPTELIDAGAQVVVPLRWGGRGKASGAEFEERETWVFTVREGRVTRVNEYAAKAAALEAVDLQE